MYCAVLDGNFASGLVASEAGLGFCDCAAFWVSSRLVAWPPISGWPSEVCAAVSVEAGAEVSAPVPVDVAAGAEVAAAALLWLSVPSGAVSCASLPAEVL